MAKRTQLIRHNTGGADAFTGLNGEITVDTTVKELRVHDSLTAGGIPTARKDLANVIAATIARDGKMTAAQVVELTAATANLAQEIIDRGLDVDAEEARALAAEGVLQGDIDSEAATRAFDDSTLQTNIDNEASTRGSADTTLQGNIDAEATTRGNADTALQSQITTNANKIAGLNTKVIDIGEWDMENVVTVNIEHGVTKSNVRNVSIMIRSDTAQGETHYNFERISGAESTTHQISIDATNVNITRATDGGFDSTSFNQLAGFNRGWIVIQYTD